MPRVQALTDMLPVLAEQCEAALRPWLAKRAEGALAALSYARAELVWWFRHWKQVCASSSSHAALLAAFGMRSLPFLCNAGPVIQLCDAGLHRQYHPPCISETIVWKYMCQ